VVRPSLHFSRWGFYRRLSDAFYFLQSNGGLQFSWLLLFADQRWFTLVRPFPFFRAFLGRIEEKPPPDKTYVIRRFGKAHLAYSLLNTVANAV
tara:strand:- start:552 stop:830 length:279 start_codon:yes stop_codon:yes gene_type:complete